MMFKREFASFGGKCPYGCKFCYTYNPNYDILPDRTVDEIVEDLSSEDFNLIYISGHRESFYNPDQGIDLIEKLFYRYNCHILFTTRNVFNQSQIDRVANINRVMRMRNRFLFGCVSIPAFESYYKIEDTRFVPSPEQRIDFVKQLYAHNIKALLTIRPLFPNSYIDIQEPIEIVRRCVGQIDCVISSGIVIDEFNEASLVGFPTDAPFVQKPLMACLKNNYEVKYINVDKEMNHLHYFCNKNNVALFNSSIPALEYIVAKELHSKGFSNKVG